MTIRKNLFLGIFLLFACDFLYALPIAEQFREAGYVEIYEEKDATTYNCLYSHFDELIEFLQTNDSWVKKLYSAKERFIRSKERNYYSTDFFGYYDESKNIERSQISFYYSIHFHEFICSHYTEFKKIPEIMRFFEVCFQIQKPYGKLFNRVATELGLKTIFSSHNVDPPIIIKIIKYYPSYTATKPHYDGTAFSLFLDSTDNDLLLLSPYKPSFSVSDFFSPQRWHNQNSILLIPGVFLAEFFIYPTPHIVAQSGKIRYATIAFAMRPYYTSPQIQYSSLPSFKD